MDVSNQRKAEEKKYNEENMQDRRRGRKPLNEALDVVDGGNV